MTFAHWIGYSVLLQLLLVPSISFGQVRPLKSGDLITQASLIPEQTGNGPVTFAKKSIYTLTLLIEGNGDRKFLRPDGFVHYANDRFFTGIMALNKPTDADRRFVRFPQGTLLQPGMEWDVPTWNITTQCGKMAVNYKAISENGPEVILSIDGADTRIRTIRVNYESRMPTCKDGWTYPWKRTHEVLYSPELNELISSKRIDWSAWNNAFLADGKNSGDGWVISAIQTSKREKVAGVPAAEISHGHEKSITQLQAELVSPWLVTVEGEGRTRTLRITSVAQQPDESLLLEAFYGFTDGNQGPIRASVSKIGQQSTLRFVTQANAQVAATQLSNGNFEGTFTYKERTKAITIEKMSESDLQLKVGAAKAARAAPVIVKPAADVPSSCASFSGEWTGTWTEGGIGQYWLWVVDVDANCVAKYAYLSHSRPPVGFATVEIKDGALPIVNRSTGGTSFFERHGDELWARYSNPTGGRNSAVFKKVQ